MKLRGGLNDELKFCRSKLERGLPRNNRLWSQWGQMDVKSAYQNFALGHLVEYDDAYRVVRNFISLFNACIIYV